MSLQNQFISFISKENLFTVKDKLLLAVSGGVDSVVLCELCRQAGYDFIIAHCNFQLREAESERDEQFVRSLGTKYNTPVLIKRFETRQYAAAHTVSIQVAARDLRYAWFDEIVKRETSDVRRESSDVSRQALEVDSLSLSHDSRFTTHVVTAHHLNDNIETMLMNFFRGTGIAGLRGMLPKQGKVVRPLLFVKKEAIKKFAEENQLSWVEDSSNQSDKYARNYLRHQLVPLVKNLYPEAENNLIHNLERFKDIEALYHQAIEQHKKKLLEYKGNEIHIPVLKLQKALPLVSIVYEIIKDYHFSPGQTDEVIDLLNSDTGKYIQSATHRIFKNRNWLIIAPLKTRAADNILIEQPCVVEFGSDDTGGKMELVIRPGNNLAIPHCSGIAHIDAANITFPLLLRKWKAGDYFYPLGMRKKKKLARFFIDQKLSKTDKEKIWVLESDKKIVWVAGHRIDDRFKITPQTKNILQAVLKAF